MKTALTRRKESALSAIKFLIMKVKKCPECKSEMKKVEFDVEYGIAVNSLHCENCGFNITENKKLENALIPLKE